MARFPPLHQRALRRWYELGTCWWCGFSKLRCILIKWSAIRTCILYFSIWLLLMRKGSDWSGETWFRTND
jgi:hypothetical protein